MSHHILHKALRTFGKILLGLFIVILISPCLLYVPFIQDLAKEIAVKQVKESTGMDISVGLVRLRFPLKVELRDIDVAEPSGDTLSTVATLGSARVGVRLLPLLHGTVEADALDIDNVSYRLGTPDSAIFMTAHVNSLRLNTADIRLSDMAIDLDEAVLDGARIRLVLKDTVTPEKPDTAAPSPLTIRARRLVLKNVDYTMRMLPVIDSLAANIPSASLTDGSFDMITRRIHARSFNVDSVSAAYFIPALADTTKAAPPADTAAPLSEPWTVTADRVSLSGRSLTYAVSGAKPSEGFDLNYISVTGVGIDIDSLYNRATSVRVPLRRLEARERCGLPLSASGLFDMDSTRLTARGFDISVGSSRLLFDAMTGMGDPARDPSLPLMLKADGKVAVADIEQAMPSMRKMLLGVPRKEIVLAADIDGTAGKLDIGKLLVDWPGYLRLAAHGSIADPTDFRRMNGRIDLDGRINNINFLKPTLLDAAMARAIKLPPMTIKGTVDYRPGLVDGNVALVTGSGRVALKGSWNSRAEGYNATLDAVSFPVDDFLPALGLADVSAKATVKGNGYNPLSPRTAIDASIRLGDLSYQGRRYSDISLTAHLADGKAEGSIISRNPGADLDADFLATLSPDEYTWDISGTVNELDLAALGLSTAPMSGRLGLATQGSYRPRTENVDAKLSLSDLAWKMDGSDITVPSLDAVFNASDSLTLANLRSGDLHFDAYAYTGLRPLLKMLTDLTPFINTQIAGKQLDVRALQQHLPPMDLSFRAGASNPVATYLAQQKIAFRNAALDLHNDSLLSMQASVTDFAKDKFAIDTVRIDASQHGKFLVYKLSMDNRPGTLDDFAHVLLNGFIADDRVAFLVNQRNISGEQGFYIGMTAAFTDTTVNVRVVPAAPVIAYQKWKLNTDNSISFNFDTKHVDANLKLTNGKSLAHIYTDHRAAHADSTASDVQEDLVIRLSDIRLQDWLSISPFAPPVRGDLGADLRIHWDHGILMGKGTAGLTDLYYGRDRVGTFDLDIDMANDRTGAIRADVALLVDSVKVITAQGALNDSTSGNPFLLDFNMIHFPLRVVNPFLPKDVAQMKGMLNGTMKITGSMARPVFNGYLNFDSTAVRVGFTGVSYPFSEEKIPVDSNVVRFNDYTIGGLNGKDLYVNGTVDARSLSDIGIDLALKADGMQIVNSSRPRGANVYGKAFIDLDATARGNLRFLDVNADLSILPETNATYVMTSTASSLSSQSSADMVTFVSFNDTTGIDADTVAENSSMLLNLNARLNIEEGSTLNVDISTDGKNKASIKGFGSLDYSLNPMNDGRLTGRFTINSGFVRYTPPLMSEKNFKFTEGSYINFTGDMLNPTLNVRAVDEMKANVTQEGQNSRLVNFFVTLALTQTLQNMNVAFDLSTNDDITISNELQAMSPDQRANQAMNLLLYNVYTGPGTKGNTNLSGNPLFSFLTSQVNTWAANNIKFVDISFGIDQYDQTTNGQSSTTTSYSYRVSKTLFNDRIKIVIGGNYSTDAGADENLQQNLINDISFEYMLNRSGSMYARLFRHVGYESILEGEITETGVGFVYRRKLNSLRDLFRWRRSPAPAPQKPDAQSAKPENTDSEER